MFKEGQGFILGLAICFVVGMFPAWGIIRVYNPAPPNSTPSSNELTLEAYELGLDAYNECVSDIHFKIPNNPDERQAFIIAACGHVPSIPVFADKEKQ